MQREKKAINFKYDNSRKPSLKRKILKESLAIGLKKLDKKKIKKSEDYKNLSKNKESQMKSHTKKRVINWIN